MRITLEKTTKVVKYLILSLWVMWAFMSVFMLLDAGSDTLLISYYLFYLLCGTITLILVRKDIFSPPGIFILAGFVTFGFNIPLIASGLAPKIHISDATLIKVMIVFLSATLSFLTGYLVQLHKLIPTAWIVNLKRPSREAGILLYVLLACYLVVAGMIRINFHLGEAGVQPKIEYAGYVQYILYDGVLILCLWYLAQGLRKGKLHMLLGLSLLLGLATTQALLGWRGGMFQMLVLTIIVFWYQKRMYEKQKVQSFLWLLLLVIFLSSIVELGNAVRVKRLGADAKFTQENFVDNILTRGQGTTRLAEVVKYFGPITFTNGFLITRLVPEGLSTTQYIDRKIYGVTAKQSNSFGTSGPGGPYTAMGLMGVLSCFGLLGGFYRSVYENIFLTKTEGVNLLGVVFYAALMFSLFAMLSENLNLNSVKGLVAIGGQIFVYKMILFQKFSTNKVQAS